MVIETQGAIHDHAQEHLVTSDVAIIRARRLLLEAMDAVAAGEDPPGVVRDSVNDALRHAVAGTQTVSGETSNEDFCRALERSDLYTLTPL